MAIFGSKNRRAGNDARLFDEACAQAQTDVHYLLRREDLYPVHISPNFERVFGVEAQRLIDDVDTLQRFMPDEDRLRLKREVRTWDEESTLRIEFDYLMPGGNGGRARPAAAGRAPQPAQPAGGNPAQPDPARPAPERKHFRCQTTPVHEGAYLLVSMVDTTAEQAALDEARRERDRAQELVEGRTDFMSQMSHEIRTPLNGIKGLITLSQEHQDDKERLLDDLSRASDLSNYLLALINDALDMSRLNSGHVELECAPFDMRLITAELRSMFEAQAAQRQLSFNVEMQDCRDVFLIGDRMRLNQIIVNFISNALKFTDAGGSVTVTLREMYRDGDTVNYMIRVRDTGKGMDPRFVSRIFKPFEQEDRTIARRYGGTGLGMAITSGLVKLMEGEIVVDTELGRGSDFTVYVPLALAGDEARAMLAARGETLETADDRADVELAYDFNGKHFLMAEDNDLNAMIAEEILGNLGSVVDRADDGPTVVAAFAASAPNTFDAILMDVQMPTFSGWEATRRIRALDRPDAQSVPIIALSANNYTEDARASREAGMNGHAGKPLDISELKAQLAAATAESAYRGSER